MSLTDTIVSGVAALIAAALLVAGVTQPDHKQPEMPDASCASSIVTELVQQKKKLAVIVEQSQRARGIAERLDKEDRMYGR